jgi:hypothetical protein
LLFCGLNRQKYQRKSQKHHKILYSTIKYVMFFVKT